MSVQIYRKAGETLRIEKSRGVLVTLQVSEQGVAHEEVETFTASPHPFPLSPAGRGVRGEEAARLAESLAAGSGGVEVERLTILSGRAEHRMESGTESCQWSEESARIHIALASRRERIRVSLDLGADTLQRIDVGPIAEIAAALDRVARPRSQTVSLLLLPQVSAELWLAIVLGVRDPIRSAATLAISQSQHPRFALDGDGRPIQSMTLVDLANGVVARHWPNRYRPSYRTRPMPMPFHLRASHNGKPQGTQVQAVGVVEPFQIIQGWISARLLCSLAEGSQAYVARVSMQLVDFLAKIRYVADEVVWFPYAAGSYGGEVELEAVQLEP